ncbi:hypothetical protein OL239_07190 [Arthrobacter sp. ATA002]|uniref:hypothetical protein n=1 Tax=Arthrobacter sp. ATA002 TaxID=2991715 RepID=UPI0022A777C5|nr:hypothetical protein [Arthrobacter sp. ATA002]WAP52914.1 hypothetical protein OL239_07190 [Arthrobacter sp. ATA002]
MNYRLRDLSQYEDAPLHQYNSFRDFLRVEVRHGISRISSNEMHLDFLYEDKGSPVTFVYFHAALGLKQAYPFFGGRGMIDGFPVNYLGIADPVAGLVNAPTAGWHLGTSQMPLHENLAQVIAHVLATGSGTQLMFFGASAGGFASLYYGAQFKSSLSVVVNPRTALFNSPHTFEEYRDVAYPGTQTDDFGSFLSMDTATLHASGEANTVAYIQNLQDKRFLNNQLIPFLEQCPGNERIYLKVGEYGVGHVVPPRSVLRKAIKASLRTAPDWKRGLLADGFSRGPSADGLADASRASIKAASSGKNKRARTTAAWIDHTRRRLYAKWHAPVAGSPQRRLLRTLPTGNGMPLAAEDPAQQSSRAG